MSASRLTDIAALGIRPASPGDDGPLARLAQLDEAPVPPALGAASRGPRAG